MFCKTDEQRELLVWFPSLKRKNSRSVFDMFPIGLKKIKRY